MTCPNCAAAVADTDAFCENCGTELSARADVPTTPGVAQSPEGASARTHLISLAEPSEPPPLPCHNCGGVIGPDGWCTVCGARGSNGREHVTEQPSPTVAAVSDRGRLHPRNEDAFAVATRDGWTALIVCDGVTTAADSDAAAFAAAQAARDLLIATERPAGDAATREQHWTLQAKAAAVAADVAAEATANPTNNPGATGATAATVNPPSCTFVAAIADGDVIVAANVGDSRAYWLPDEGAAEQLSVDDSWATEQIRAGVPRDEAEADPKAHAITRWLGIDSPPVDASTSTVTAPGPGWLLVCSDGLWNYCSDADQLRDLVNKQPPEPLARAEALVAWANEQGGHDNITVTLARIGDAP